MSTSQIPHPVRVFNWARIISWGVVIFGALIICYGVIARLIEDSKPPDPLAAYSITDRSVPPLKPFSRTSSRFAKEITFAALPDCPTPGIIGEPQFFASKGFLRSSGALNDLCNYVRKRRFYYRYMQQPEQAVRFTSRLTIAEIYPQLDAHFRQSGFLRNSFRDRVDENGLAIDSEDKPLNTWREAWWNASFFRPFPRIPATSPTFNPVSVRVEFIQRVQDETTGVPLGAPYTEVKIQAEEHKYPDVEG